MGNQCMPRRSNLINNLKNQETGATVDAPLSQSLIIVVATWVLDRYNLFDQQDQENIQVTKLKVTNNCRIIKKSKQSTPQIIEFSSNSTGLEIDLNVTKNKLGYQIQNNSSKSKQNWERVFDEWLQISPGDTFKTGLTVFQMKKLILDEDYLGKEHKNQQKIKSMTHIGDNQCRICLENQYTNKNPLISPCQCMGSVKYIHIQCLKQWLFASQQKSQDFISIDLKKSKCEICKATLVQSVAYQNIIATIISGSNSIPTPFAIFQGLHIDRTKTELKNYFVYSFKKNKTFSIGRGSKVQMRTDVDQTVSRFHAEIKLKKQKVFLRDVGSKFGTTKKIPGPIIIPKDSGIKRLQFGSTSISIFFERQGQEEVQATMKQIPDQRKNQNNRIMFSNNRIINSLVQL